ncbi:hypothetical protein MRX96_019354 [Rhipicephalus microplus]
MLGAVGAVEAAPTSPSRSRRDRRREHAVPEEKEGSESAHHRSRVTCVFRLARAPTSRRRWCEVRPSRLLLLPPRVRRGGRGIVREASALPPGPPIGGGGRKSRPPGASPVSVPPHRDRAAARAPHDTDAT